MSSSASFPQESNLSARLSECDTLTRLAAFCCRAFGLDHCFVYLEDGRSAPSLVGHGEQCDPSEEVLAFLHRLSGNEEPEIFEDASIPPIEAPAPIRFLVVLPLSSEVGDLLGTLILFMKRPHKVSEAHLRTFHAISGLAADILESRAAKKLIAEVASDKSKIELALAESQARYRRISDNVPGMLFQFEMRQDGVVRFPFVGGGSEPLLGLTPADIVNDPFRFMDLVVEGDMEGMRRSMFESVVTGCVWEFEVRFRHPDGQVRWIHGVSRPEYRLNGAILWDGILLDVTQHKLTESALASSEERFRLTFETALDGILSLHPDGTIRGWNSQASKIFGYDESEAIGKDFYSLFCAHDLRANGCFEFSTCPSTLGQRIETIGIRQNNVRFPVEVAITHIGETDTATCVAFVRDITDRRRAAEDLQLAVEEAERANRSKSDFLSRMSHELRTPLNAILGFSQLLQMEDLNPECVDAVSHINGAGKHLLSLINEVLDIARIEAGKISLTMEEVQAAGLVLEVAAFLQPLADQLNVKLSFTEPEQEIVAYADSQRLRQVIINLLSNGIKYTRASGNVWARVERLGDLVKVEVEDDGNGIAPEAIDRLFTPFDRLGADNTQVEGTGLGLPLAKRLVEAMGGAISVRSVVGKGSTFTVSLPARLEGDEAQARSQIEQPIAQFLDC